MVRAAIGLGSNVGDRRRHLNDAIDALHGVGRIMAVSPVYETEPVGGPAQDPYLNAVALVDTELAPVAVLEALLRIEADHGRERRERFGPRTLDLDLLLYGMTAVDEPGLRVPHPRLTERRFALQPLLDVWPDATHPDGTVLADFLPRLADQVVHRRSLFPAWAVIAMFVATGLVAAGVWVALGQVL